MWITSNTELYFISGDTCKEQGCPGVGSSCSGHGLCIQNKQICTCDNNWQGEGCEEPKCDGDPYMCNQRGTVLWLKKSGPGCSKHR